MNEPTEAGSENAPILFDPSPVEKLLLFAVVALTIAVIILGVKLSNVDGGSSGSGGCSSNHTHSVWVGYEGSGSTYPSYNC